MPGDGSVRALTDLLRWGPKRPETDKPASAVAGSGDAEVVVSSKALTRFLAALSSHEAPVLLDLGPVVGSNVAFYGERLGCKLFVEDVYADLERHARARTVDELPAFFEKRLTQADASVDGILCWDLFDYLDRASAQALAHQLVRILRANGALMGFFCTTGGPLVQYVKYAILDDTRLRHRPYPATATTRHVVQNRDIIRMFEGLIVSDSFLLKNNTREILFRRQG